MADLTGPWLIWSLNQSVVLISCNHIMHCLNYVKDWAHPAECPQRSQCVLLHSWLTPSWSLKAIQTSAHATSASVISPAQFKTNNHKCWASICRFISAQCFIFIFFISHFWKQLSKVCLYHHTEMMDEETEPHGRSGSHSRDETDSVPRLLLLPSDLLYTAWPESFHLPIQTHSPLPREAGLCHRVPLSLSHTWVWLLQSPGGGGGAGSKDGRRWWLELLSPSSLSEWSRQENCNPGSKPAFLIVTGSP